MYRLFFAFVALLLFAISPLGTHSALSSRTVPASETLYDDLILALIQVESSGSDEAVGDLNLRDKSYGCLQIRQPAVDDYNQTNQTSWKAEDCLRNRELSITICKWYLGYYASESRLGRAPTLEDRARIWNGGPNGWKKSGTHGYWIKVQKALVARGEVR